MLPPLETFALGPVRDRLPSGLALSRVLEEYDGPLLSQYVTPSGVYIEKWCAYDETYSRVLLVRSHHRTIALYLAGQIPMRSLLTKHSDGVGHLIDRSLCDENNARTARVLISSVRKHLPEEGVMHDESLRPAWDVEPHSYLIDNSEWDAKMLAKIERKYNGAAAFSVLAADDSDFALPVAPLDYDYSAGYPYKHLFQYALDELPARLRPRTVGVNANSPGIFTIEAPLVTARFLRRALAAAAGARTEYDTVHEWSKIRKKNLSSLPKDALSSLTRLCEKLHVSVKKLFPKEGAATAVSNLLFSDQSLIDQQPETEQVWVAGKLITSYYRRLVSFSDQEQGIYFVDAHKKITHQLEMLTDEPDDF